MTRKQLIIFFADYHKCKSFTVERDKHRILVEVSGKFFPADLQNLSKKIKRMIEPVTIDGACYLLIRF